MQLKTWPLITETRKLWAIIRCIGLIKMDIESRCGTTKTLKDISMWDMHTKQPIGQRLRLIMVCQRYTRISISRLRTALQKTSYIEMTCHLLRQEKLLRSIQTILIHITQSFMNGTVGAWCAIQQTYRQISRTLCNHFIVRRWFFKLTNAQKSISNLEICHVRQTMK